MLKTKIIPGMLLIMALTSCIATENYYQSEIVSKSDRPCNSRADHMYLFFDGEPIDFEYEVVGLIKATGKKRATGDDVLNHLKYEAWNNCANAIINISQETVTKAYLETEHNLADTYNVSAYSGLAIQVVADSEFTAKYQNKQISTDFTKAVEKQKKTDNSKKEAGNALGVLAIVGGVIIVAIALL